jgi:NADH ubiquinone oxidoreductase, 20 Kd subunit
VSATPSKPKLAVWKFSSCDGCQLSLLSCEDELLTLVGQVDIAYFLETSRAVVDGPYDLSLVEGSITTELDAERIHRVRRVSRRLVTIGACATAGGIQGLRNFTDVEDLIAAVYPTREYVATLEHSTAISAHVPVDFELQVLPGQQVSATRGDPGLARQPRGTDPRLQRLPGVQVARQQLRHGRPRHALPGPGDARRLRRFVPVVQSRLLRLLRADGVAQHRSAERLAAQARLGRRQPGSRVHIQGERAGLPTRK